MVQYIFHLVNIAVYNDPVLVFVFDLLQHALVAALVGLQLTHCHPVALASSCLQDLGKPH